MPDPFVLDCSVTMAWCFADEAGPYTDRALESLAEREAWAPDIWQLEVANVLVVAERRKRLTKADSTRFIGLLQALPIRVAPGAAERGLNAILTLARDQKLSAYDAAYLELAMRMGCELATEDTALRRASRRCGVALF